VTRAAAHGVLVVDKPSGPTSHDLVRDARKLWATREVGHAGTLDPLASGVLVLLFGEATKLSSHLTLHDKRYRGVVAFGRSTDTLDAMGTVIDERPVTPAELDDAAIERALELERARREQEPPLFSAISVEGRRAHRIGRSGQSVALPARPVRVFELRTVARDVSSVTLELLVSKGYYVRSLARDLGQALGVPAHLAALRRLASGPFTLEQAVAWPPAERPGLLALGDAAERALPTALLTADGVRRARQGRALAAVDFERPPASGPEISAWLGPDRSLVALGRESDAGGYSVVRGFRDLSEP
jgi:tRNA pseudouridine55 synthase